VSRGQVLARRKILEEGARARFPPLFGAGGGLSKLCPQARVLSGKSRRPGDITFGGERRSFVFPAEDGNRRSTGQLSSAWQSRGILRCLDQKQAASAPVSRSRAGQSADGDTLGLPYLEPATVDPFAQTTARASQWLNSENRRVRKRRNRHEQHRLKSQNLPCATKANLRETFLHSFKPKGCGTRESLKRSFEWCGGCATRHP
jgi:hypothetical protein